MFNFGLAVTTCIDLAVACGVCGGVLFYAVIFSYEMSWMKFGTELNQFLMIFLPTF